MYGCVVMNIKDKYQKLIAELMNCDYVKRNLVLNLIQSLWKEGYLRLEI